MDFKKELSILIRARYPIIYIHAKEEVRLEYTIKNYIGNLQSKVVYTWDFISGFPNIPSTTRNPTQALELIEKISTKVLTLFILKDFDLFFEDLAISRKLKNLSHSLRLQSKTIIIVSSRLSIPEELEEIITVINFNLPEPYELRQEVLQLSKSLNQPLSYGLLEKLVRSSQGLSINKVRKVFSRSVARYKEINNLTVTLLLEEKRQIINQTKILEFWSSEKYISDIGGLDSLKSWLATKLTAFSEQSISYGIPIPKGVLLVGVQGTGKSLTAKAIANEWKLPLLRLDVGRLFGGVIGESESKVRQMIEYVELLSPCVLWIDEIDKAFSSINSNNDSGTTNRVFSTLITWLSEKTLPVFVVATANNINALPLEIIRKGRFDEIFFIGLPNLKERESIFQVHLSRVRPYTWKDYNLKKLSLKTVGFSGAEIYQLIIEGMHIGFLNKREFTTDDILLCLDKIIPLSKLNPDQIYQLQEWSESGKIRKAS